MPSYKIRRNRHLAYYAFLWAVGVPIFIVFLPFAVAEWISTAVMEIFGDVTRWRWNTARLIALGKDTDNDRG